MATCTVCNGWVADDLTADHIRLIHPGRWDEPETWSVSMIRCAGCGEAILGNYVYHQRLNAHVHFTDACMRDVDGEDIRTHTVLMVTRTSVPRPHAQPEEDA